jgi:hypothetical protein
MRAILIIVLIALAGCSSQKTEEQSSVVVSAIRLTDL